MACCGCSQLAAPVTADLLAERQDALRALGSGPEAQARRAELQAADTGLLSQISAFKAANPAAGFADFVRWFSPADWQCGGGDAAAAAAAAGGPAAGGQPGDCPGQLSARMSEVGNLWRRLWDRTAAAPVEDQPPVFGYNSAVCPPELKVRTPAHTKQLG